MSDLSKSLRTRVWQKTGGKCWYCGKDLVHVNRETTQSVPVEYWFTIDHATPVNCGGNHKIENLLPCCRSCNSAKSEMTVEEFRATRIRKRLCIPTFTPDQIAYLLSIGVTLPEITPGPADLFFAERETTDAIEF